jgi:mono/diheme cytochrome c family protein
MLRALARRTLEVRLRLTHLMPAALVLLGAASLGAQHTPTPPPPKPPATPPPGPAQPPAAAPDEDEAKWDAAAVERGKQIQVTQCGFCHGSNARGGQQGPDLVRSALVQSDEDGKQLGEFLKVGRPEKNMPAFPNMPEKDVQDLAEYLHATIDSVADRGKYKILDILVGDAKKGQAFFTGAGKCSTCHSPTGDLKGIGSKFEDAVQLQQRLVMPRGRRRWGPPPPGQKNVPPFLEPTAVKATVTMPSGETFTGPFMGLTDFEVVIYDTAREAPRTFLRHDGVPKVTLTDPLQAHVDMLRKWTDDDMHNMTAFLATLK